MEACAGRLNRVSNKPHALCRDCQLFWYGITGGIRPAWSETDGRAECGSRVHVFKVVDERQLRSPSV